MISCLYEPFKHWSKSGSVYIISDLHFCDSGCKLMDENWISPEEQVERINKLVHKNDTLVVLGDVGNVEYVKGLKSNYKVLIMGNHDSGATNYLRKKTEKEDNHLFNEVYEGPLFISEKIFLSHEPYDVPFAVNIHGHDHAGTMRHKNGINLAANVCNYTPISLAVEIKNGLISKVPTIHRICIDNANKKPIHKRGNKQ